MSENAIIFAPFHVKTQMINASITRLISEFINRQLLTDQ